MTSEERQKEVSLILTIMGDAIKELLKPYGTIHFSVCAADNVEGMYSALKESLENFEEYVKNLEVAVKAEPDSGVH